MARPTINFQSGGLMTGAGPYNFTVQPGVEYILTLTGVFDGATFTLSIYDGTKDALYAVTDGAATAYSEIRLVSPHAVLSFAGTSTGANTSVCATFTPIIQPVK